MKIKNKQISVSIILTSVLLLIYSTIAKSRRYEYLPEGEYDVDFFIFEIPYLKVLFFLLLILGVGVFFLLFKSDQQLIKPFKNLQSKDNSLSHYIPSVRRRLRQNSLMKIHFPFAALREARVFFKQWIKSFYKVLIISFVGLILIISLISYWLKLDNSADPLSLWEAFFLSYGKILFIVALATVALGVVNNIFFTDRKELNKKEEGNKMKVREKIPEKAPNSQENITPPRKTTTGTSPSERNEKDVIIPTVTTETSKENFLRGCILLCLFWTMYVSISTGFYLAFFMPLAYYFYMTLKAKSIKEAISKSLLYPLGFFIFLVIIGAAIEKSNYSYDMSFDYFLGGEFAEALLPFILCSALTFASLRKKVKNPEIRKSKINWSYLTVVIVSVLLGSGVLYAQHKIDSFDFSSLSKTTNEDLDLVPYIGKNIQEEEVLDLISMWGSKPVVQTNDGAKFYNFYNKGVAFNITEEGNIHMIFMYSGGKDGEYSRFTGKLPYELSFGDSKYEVKEKLGKAEDIDEEEFWWWSKRVNITFKGGQVDQIVVF